MRKRRLIFSDAAIADIMEQADWYAARSGRGVARRWENAVASAISFIIRRPAAGSSCTFSAPELKGVRRMSISRFPRHLLFYRFDEDEVFILRVVHGARDLEPAVFVGTRLISGLGRRRVLGMSVPIEYDCLLTGHVSAPHRRTDPRR
jgi:toxin ParE1/3/4